MATGGVQNGVGGTPLRWAVSGVVLAVAAFVWIVAAWLIAQQLVDVSLARVLEREQDEVSPVAAAAGANLGFALAHLHNLPTVLAIDPEIVRALTRMGPDVKRNRQATEQFRHALLADRALSQLAARLTGMVGKLDVDQVWVINAAGDCIASGGFPAGATATGVNYVDREYFWEARRDGSSQQFAVGRTTQVPGIYHSAAVVDAGRFLGVVVVKVDVTRLARLVSDANMFITDENGVVVIAGDAALLMKTVPGAAADALSANERLARYRRETFEALAIEAVDVDGFRLYRFAGRREPMLAAFASNPADRFKVWFFRDVDELAQARAEFGGIYLVLLVGGESLLLAAAARVSSLRRRREHRAEMAQVNAELVKLNEELQVQARFDSLTGCRNRRYFLEEVGNEIKRATRFAQPCALAMLDIDRFKEVNDRYGHATGDALLKHFVQTVGGRLRASDFLGRLGGEEFALLMPQTDRRGALEVAERIRGAVEAASAILADVELRITVSIGVDAWRGADDHVESLVARADAAMYQAKRDGRNRVRISDAPPATALCP